MRKPLAPLFLPAMLPSLTYSKTCQTENSSDSSSEAPMILSKQSTTVLNSHSISVLRTAQKRMFLQSSKLTNNGKSPVSSKDLKRLCFLLFLLSPLLMKSYRERNIQHLFLLLSPFLFLPRLLYLQDPKLFSTFQL